MTRSERFYLCKQAAAAGYCTRYERCQQQGPCKNSQKWLNDNPNIWCNSSIQNPFARYCEHQPCSDFSPNGGDDDCPIWINREQIHIPEAEYQPQASRQTHKPDLMVLEHEAKRQPGTYCEEQYDEYIRDFEI